MLVSLEWLREFLDLGDLNQSQLAEILVGIGHEVEKTEIIAPIPESVVAGEITSARPHPDADKLQLCRVDIGAPEPLNIVCGAPNARAGIKVAVATPGTDLGGGFIIKPVKVRGVFSSGMLCSETELNIGEEGSGILELDSWVSPGTPLEEVLPRADSILELALTPNRGDCLSYLGLARDLSARLKKSLKVPDSSVSFQECASLGAIRIHVDADAGCGRMTSLVMGNLPRACSPYRIRRRLRASGVRPVSLIVDVTNYVLLETGQPVHAYDRRFLSGESLRVRSAHQGELLEILNGQNIRLQPGDLVVCDEAKPIALAGIMGGANSQIREDTSSLVLEVAHFDPVQIRKTAKRLALHTEASSRFERGVDLERIPDASKRVASLLQDWAREAGLAPVQIAGETIDWYPGSPGKKRIALRLRRVRSILGLPGLSLAVCIRHLEALQLCLIDKTSERMLFEVPGFRHDLCREIDLIEEVGRMEGFEKVPYELPKLSISTLREDPAIQFADQLRTGLASLGMNEAVSFPFHGTDDYRKLGLQPEHPLWPGQVLANPLNDEMSCLNSSLLPSMVRAVIRNRHHGQKGSRLFEIGRVFFAGNGHRNPEHSDAFPWYWQISCPDRQLSPGGQEENGRVLERNILAGICDDPYTSPGWQGKGEAPGFFHGKELLTRLLSLFTSRRCQWKRPENPDEVPWLHPNASACMQGEGLILGYIGELHPLVARAWGLKGREPLVFEMDVDALLSYSRLAPCPLIDRGKFPPVLRDFSFLVDEGISWQAIESSIASFPCGKLLQNSELFDLYQGDGLPKGKKSFAVAFTFAAPDKTLTDRETDKEAKELLNWLRNQTGAELR